jgi:hypothetical protein
MQAQTPTPPAPNPGLPPISGDLASVQQQLAAVNVKLQGYRAQRDGLRRQLGDMLQDNPARPGIQRQWADAGAQVAHAEGEAAALKARIAQLSGVSGDRIGDAGQLVTPPSQGHNRQPDPDAIAVMSFLVAISFVLPISIALARRILRTAPKATPSSRPDDSTQRLDRIEQAVDTIAIEVERVSEGQRFITKLMAERSPAAQSTQEGAGMRALGMGAAEPVAQDERVKAKQPVTPH